jgi:hypothetical protein
MGQGAITHEMSPSIPTFSSVRDAKGSPACPAATKGSNNNAGRILERRRLIMISEILL